MTDATFIEKADAPPAFTAEELSEYLVRIGYTGPLNAEPGVLAKLQQHHLGAIPFEALDVLLGRGVQIDARSIFDKLVRRRRGGYCYEHNGLFARALESLGFQVAPRVARVLWGGRDPEAAPLRTHMLLLVEASGVTWLVDVGFGAAVPPQPLLWDSDAIQETPFGRYRLTPTDFGRLVQTDVAGIWRPAYEVYREPPKPVDFEVFNWFTSTHPSSPFRRELFAARLTGEGRFTLFGAELTRRLTSGERRRERLTAEGLQAALRDVFGIPVEAEWQGLIQEVAGE